MDPNANLKEMLELAEAFVSMLKRTKRLEEYEIWDDDYVLTLHADAARLGELVLALDHWIKTGGGLPKSWGQRGGK